MILEQDIRVVVMLCDIVELGEASQDTPKNASSLFYLSRIPAIPTGQPLRTMSVTLVAIESRIRERRWDDLWKLA